MAIKYIPLYFSFAEQLALLPDAECGKLILALLAYAEFGKNPNFEPSSAVAMLFSCMRSQIERDTEKYNEKCEKNRKNAQKGWKERGASDGMRSHANDANKKESEKESENEKENEILFEKFWDAYPKHQDRLKAQKAFSALDVDQKLLEEILKALDWQTASPNWAADDGKYIPNAASYLENHRWEDEPPQSQSAAAQPRPHLKVVIGSDGTKEAVHFDE